MIKRSKEFFIKGIKQKGACPNWQVSSLSAQQFKRMFK